MLLQSPCACAPNSELLVPPPKGTSAATGVSFQMLPVAVTGTHLPAKTLHSRHVAPGGFVRSQLRSKSCNPLPYCNSCLDRQICSRSPGTITSYPPRTFPPSSPRRHWSDSSASDLEQ